MTADFTRTVTGTRSRLRSRKSGTQMERKWNANGTRMEREWNANGTHLRTRSGRVPNEFSVRLFLSSTVVQTQTTTAYCGSNTTYTRLHITIYSKLTLLPDNCSNFIFFLRFWLSLFFFFFTIVSVPSP